MFALSSRETLTHEINQKYYSVKERDQTSRKKKAWCESLECCIKELYPSSRLVLVGSSASGFAIEGCDVDLTLVRQGRQVFYRLDSDVEVLRKIRDRLATRRSSVITELISGAVVPILKMNDKREGLEGDISVDITNSIFNTYLQKCYGSLDHRVTPLIVIIKYWAKMSRITDARDHKLSGFAVVLLVIYYLQTGCSPQVIPSLQSADPINFSTSLSAEAIADKLVSGYLPSVVTSYRSSNQQSLGSLLVGFFDYYSTFNWNRVLSVRQAGTRAVPYDKKWTRPYIRIEDPFDGRNVTRAVYQFGPFSDIKQAITRAKQRLAYERCHLTEIL